MRTIRNYPMRIRYLIIYSCRIRWKCVCKKVNLKCQQMTLQNYSTPVYMQWIWHYGRNVFGRSFCLYIRKLISNIVHQFSAYEQLDLKHEPLTLIPPQFEVPLPPLESAVCNISDRISYYNIISGISTELSRTPTATSRDVRFGRYVFVGTRSSCTNYE
jgi:hypothetical protein